MGLLLSVPTRGGGPGAWGRVGQGDGLWATWLRAFLRGKDGVSLMILTGKAELLGEGDHSFPAAFSLQKARVLPRHCRLLLGLGV